MGRGGGENMEFPKLVIASDGRRTGALLDGVFIGRGIERLDFSTQDKGGNLASTIRIMDLDVRSVSFSRDTDCFFEFLKELADKD